MKQYTGGDLLKLGMPDPADVENLVNRLKGGAPRAAAAAKGVSIEVVADLEADHWQRRRASRRRAHQLLTDNRGTTWITNNT